MPSSVTPAVKSYSFLIDYQCPQCGAPATLTETDRVFTCGYCRSKSYLTDMGGFRYRFQPAGPAGEDLVYFPYWRFKGMLFSCTPAGVQHRFVDMSLQASPSRLFPVSLGLRSQALKLTYVMPDAPGRFIPPQLSRSEMLTRLEERFCQGIQGPILHQCEIGETVSLIYSPYRVKDRVVDAILDQPISPLLAAEDLDAIEGGKPGAGVRFLPTLCPHCGWDLEGARDAHLLSCGNCRSVWTPGREDFQRMAAGYLEGGDAAYLPFWRIQAEIEGLRLGSYADLVREANLPKVVQPGWEKQAFRFWAPAFKIRPATFLRLLRSVTLGQPDGDIRPDLPESERVPVAVNLPYPEAIETLKLNIAGWLRPRKRMETLLPDIRIRAKKILLVYLPFSDRHHEYVLEDLNLAVRKSQLATANNL